MADPRGAGAPIDRPIRPRGARVVAWVLFALLVVGTVIFLVVAPRVLGTAVFGLDDQLYTVVLMAIICFFVYRQATVRIVPRAEGIVVRNFVTTRRLAWAQVVGVRCGPDHPWGRLDLSDGTTMSAMGIQTSDGEFAMSEARRLATLLTGYEGHGPDEDL